MRERVYKDAIGPAPYSESIRTHPICRCFLQPVPASGHPLCADELFLVSGNSQKTQFHKKYFCRNWLPIFAASSSIGIHGALLHPVSSIVSERLLVCLHATSVHSSRATKKAAGVAAGAEREHTDEESDAPYQGKSTQNKLLLLSCSFALRPFFRRGQEIKCLETTDDLVMTLSCYDFSCAGAAQVLGAGLGRERQRQRRRSCQ